MQQINDFRIEDMAWHLHNTAPALWNSVYSLLSSSSSSSSAASHFASESKADTELDGTAEDADEAQFWKDFVNPAESSEGTMDPTGAPRPWHRWNRSERRDAIRRVVSVNLIAIAHWLTVNYPEGNRCHLYSDARQQSEVQSSAECVRDILALVQDTTESCSSPRTHRDINIHRIDQWRDPISLQ